MQRFQKTIYKTCLTGITGTTWAAGLLIAGSDSPYMPWLNGIGLIIFFGASILLGKRLDLSSHSQGDAMNHPRFYQKPDIPGIKPQKKGIKINIPYAIGI